MGDHFAEGDDDELPVHKLNISAFEMDFNEVTNAEYEVCVNEGGCTAPQASGYLDRPWYYGNPDYKDFPVVNVNWYQARDYCAWAGKRLPTEAEWEYAARGGLDGARYPWGDGIKGSDANYWDSGDPWDNDSGPVGYYSPNGFGLYDMAGNVEEWVNDWYGPTYYQYCVDHSIEIDPLGPSGGTYRVMRGGAWPDYTHDLRVAYRHDLAPLGYRYYLGFRCAR
jgi:formylglycine-generating enzyme required for sulfatase activity